MFQIGSTQVHEPAYGGVQITDEPIWASNTGRASDGTMIGDIVSWKRTVQVTWPALSFKDSQTIRKAIVDGGAFFNITFNDVLPNASSSSAESIPTNTVTMTVYCANIPRTLASLNAAFRKHGNIQITFIEQ